MSSPKCTACGCEAEQWWNYCAMCGNHIAAGEATPIFAVDMRAEEEALRRRFVHHTRPKGPLSLDEAISLSKRVDGSELENKGTSMAEIREGIAGCDIDTGQAVMLGPDGKYYLADKGPPRGVAIEPIKRDNVIRTDGNGRWRPKR